MYSIYLDIEDNFVWNIDIINIEYFIILGIGECFNEGILYSIVELIYNCCVKDLSNVERVGEYL